MALTTQQQIDIGKICQVLAANELQGGKKVGATLDTRLPSLLNIVTDTLEDLYTLSPSNADVPIIGDYLISICRNQPKAQAYTAGSGSVAPVNNQQSFPIYITQDDFTSATFYPNANLFGYSIVIFVNELNRYFFVNTDFTVSSTGLTILIPGFDATTYDYNIIIEKVS